MRYFLALTIVLAGITGAFAQAQPPAPPAAPQSAGNFNALLRDLWPDAQKRGISRATFDSAFAGLTPDPRVLAATKRQPEYNKPFGAYVTGMMSAWRIQGGARKAAEWNEVFTRVEKQFSVERWPILSIWALESSFGADKDKWDVFRSVGTLAQAGYRHPYFRDELLNALQILQEGHITRREMLGSWDKWRYGHGRESGSALLRPAGGCPAFHPGCQFGYVSGAAGPQRRRSG